MEEHKERTEGMWGQRGGYRRWEEEIKGREGEADAEHVDGENSSIHHRE